MDAHRSSALRQECRAELNNLCAVAITIGRVLIVPNRRSARRHLGKAASPRSMANALPHAIGARAAQRGWQVTVRTARQNRRWDRLAGPAHIHCP
jgi:hypothetical protein